MGSAGFDHVLVGAGTGQHFIQMDPLPPEPNLGLTEVVMTRQPCHNNLLEEYSKEKKKDEKKDGEKKKR